MNVRPPAWETRGGPVVPTQFAHVTTLGQMVRATTPKEENLTLVPTIVSVVGSAILLVAVMMAKLFPPNERATALIPPFLLGGFLFGLGVYNVLHLRGSPRIVVVFDQGFAALVGSTVGVWPWAEIAAVVSKEKFVSGRRSGRTERRYEVLMKNGAVFVLTDFWFDGIEAMADSIKTQSSRLLLPPVQAEYDAGRAVPFGPVTVSRDTIRIDGRDVPWSTIANVVVKKGRLIITPRNDSPLTEKVSRIPNIEILGALIGVPASDMDLRYM